MQTRLMPQSRGVPASNTKAFDYSTLDVVTADNARQAAVSIRGFQKKVGQQIIVIGDLLIAAKQALGHGSFGDWIAAEFGWSDRTAQSYMRASQVFTDKSEIVSYLPPTALYALSASSTPEPVLQEVVQRLEHGERVTGDEIKSMVRRAKAAAKLARADAARTPEQRARRKQAEMRQQRELERWRQETSAALSREVAARREAAALIMERFGDDTPRLAELLDIGRGVFASDLRPKSLSQHGGG